MRLCSLLLGRRTFEIVVTKGILLFLLLPFLATIVIVFSLLLDLSYTFLGQIDDNHDNDGDKYQTKYDGGNDRLHAELVFRVNLCRNDGEQDIPCDDDGNAANS